MRVSAFFGRGTWALISEGANLAYGFAYIILAVRAMTRHDYGTLGIAMMLLQVTRGFTIGTVLMAANKYLAEHEGRAYAETLTTALLLLAVILLPAVLLLPLLAPWLSGVFEAPDLPALLVAYAPPLLVFWALGGLGKGLLLSRLRQRSACVADLVAVGVALACYVRAWHTGTLADPRTVLAITVLHAGLTTVGTLIAARDLIRFTRPSRASLRRLGRFAGFVALSGVANLLYNRADALILGAMLAPTAVGLYTASRLLPNLLRVITTAFASIAAPLVSRLQGRKETEEIREVYEKALAYQLALYLPLVLLLVLLPTVWLHLLFGGRYDDGAPILIALAIGALAVPLGNVPGTVATSLGKPYLDLVSQAITIVLYIGLNILLIPRYGVVGAAWANATVGWVSGLVMVAIVGHEVASRPRDIMGRFLYFYRWAARRTLAALFRRPGAPA